MRADIADHCGHAAGVRHPSAGRGDAPRGRDAMSIARSTVRARSSRPTWSAPTCCWRPRANTGRACRPAAQAAFRFHHVSTDEVFGALDPDDAPFTETTAVRSAQPLLGEQGGVGPSGPRLAPHLRPADDRQQHRQQLRPLAVPGETDPAGDAQRAGGQAAAGLWRRVEPCATGCSSRTTPRRCCACSSTASPGETYAIGARQPRSNLQVVQRDLRRAGCPRAGCRRTARAADHLRHRPARATISATRSTRRTPRRRWPGARRTTSSRGSAAHDRLVSGQPPLVGEHPRRALCRPAARPVQAAA